MSRFSPQFSIHPQLLKLSIKMKLKLISSRIFQPATNTPLLAEFMTWQILGNNVSDNFKSHQSRGKLGNENKGKTPRTMMRLIRIHGEVIEQGVINTIEYLLKNGYVQEEINEGIGSAIGLSKGFFFF